MICSEIECSEQIYGKKLCKKHYDKMTSTNKKKQVKESIIKRRKKYFNRFNNCCKICGEKPDWTLKKINLQFHHLYYEGGRTEHIKEIDGGKSGVGLLKEVEEYPERFELLCFDCHKIVGIGKTQPHKIIACDEYVSKSSPKKLM